MCQQNKFQDNLDKKIEYIVEKNVPQEVLDKKTLFKTYEDARKLAILCPTWAAQDPDKMDSSVEAPNEPGWFSYTLNQDGNPTTIYIHSCFKEKFMADEITALREVGAFPTTVGSFFYSQRFNIRNHANYDRVNPEIGGGRLSEDFKGDPEKNYYIHVDLGVKKDSTGIAMCHAEGSFHKDGKLFPKVVVDLIYGMNPKDYGGEIMIHNVRKFICSLRDKHKFNITDVSFDSWQSRDSEQILSMDGFRTHLISCDKTPYPHQALKEAINLTDPESDFWVIDYYPHEKLMEELEQLAYNRRGIPDHGSAGSKDIADALGGCTYLLYKVETEKLNSYVIFEELEYGY